MQITTDVYLACLIITIIIVGLILYFTTKSILSIISALSVVSVLIFAGAFWKLRNYNGKYTPCSVLPGAMPAAKTNNLIKYVDGEIVRSLDNLYKGNNATNIAQCAATMRKLHMLIVADINANININFILLGKYMKVHMVLAKCTGRENVVFPDFKEPESGTLNATLDTYVASKTWVELVDFANNHVGVPRISRTLEIDEPESFVEPSWIGSIHISQLDRDGEGLDLDSESKSMLDSDQPSMIDSLHSEQPSIDNILDTYDYDETLYPKRVDTEKDLIRKIRTVSNIISVLKGHVSHMGNIELYELYIKYMFTYLMAMAQLLITKEENNVNHQGYQQGVNVQHIADIDTYRRVIYADYEDMGKPPATLRRAKANATAYEFKIDGLPRILNGISPILGPGLPYMAAS